jgi:hypothetical protein
MEAEMRRKTIFLSAILIIVPVTLSIRWTRVTGQPGAEQNKSAEAGRTDDRLAALEKSVERIMRILSGQDKPVDATADKSVQKLTAGEQGQSAEAASADLTRKRFEAVEKSLANIADFLAKKDGKSSGSTCRWERVCVYITCCRFGAPPSDPGTVKCLDQCCGTYENRLVCD